MSSYELEFKAKSIFIEISVLFQFNQTSSTINNFHLFCFSLIFVQPWASIQNKFVRYWNVSFVSMQLNIII